MKHWILVGTMMAMGALVVGCGGSDDDEDAATEAGGDGDEGGSGDPAAVICADQIDCGTQLAGQADCEALFEAFFTEEQMADCEACVSAEECETQQSTCESVCTVALE